MAWWGQRFLLAALLAWRQIVVDAHTVLDVLGRDNSGFVGFFWTLIVLYHNGTTSSRRLAPKSPPFHLSLDEETSQGKKEDKNGGYSFYQRVTPG